MKILIAINPEHILTKGQIIELGGHEYARIEDVEPILARDLGAMTDLDVEEGYAKLAQRLVTAANNFDCIILPIGSPAFQFRFGIAAWYYWGEDALDKCFFAHSERKAVEVEGVDGAIEKKSVFTHKRFFNLRGMSLASLPIIV